MRVVLELHAVTLKDKEIHGTELAVLIDTNDNLEQLTCKVCAHAHNGKLELKVSPNFKDSEDFEIFKKDFGISRKISGS